MSESERMPGKRNRSHVPPLEPRASRIVKVLPGQRCRSRQAAPIPESPAPTIRTSTCSPGMSRGSALGLGSGGDLAQVERLVERLLVDTVLARDLSQRPSALRRVLDDLGRLVVADERVQRGGDRERALGRALAALEVGLDAVDALPGEQHGSAREQLDRAEQVARDQRDADVELELA